MKKKNFYSFICVISMFAACFSFVSKEKQIVRHEKEEGHALDAFDYWFNQRASAGGVIPKNSYLRSVEYVRSQMPTERSVRDKITDNSEWVSIGPDNVGGRVLAVTISPVNGNLVWAGSSSGGLWKSTNGGFGANGWTRINTGYPTMSVSSIVINPLDPNIMYIGTGEVGGAYKSRQIGTPGARATYGMGILKSTDGGSSWTLTSLIWEFSEVTAVQKLVLNPLNPNTLFAATTEGVYKSVDAGSTWAKVNDELMAMDIVLNPVDTMLVYSAHGQSNSTQNPGIYRSTDAGTSWEILGGGLPASNIGRTCLSISESDPDIIYASIANGNTAQVLGLYKTTDGGVTWTLKPTPNYLGGQGWYDNVVAVHPENPDIVFCSGLDIYKSTNGGANWTRKSFWNAGGMFTIQAGGPEGPPYYVHADHHAITFDPSNSSRVYFGCDGGVFFSADIGEHYAGVNGGFITTQFYNGFAVAETDSLIALGGLQDNGTVKYEGNKSWSKVFGGDGGWCAIDPTGADIMYEEYVFLTLSKSTNGGENWFSLNDGFFGDIGANFIAPFVICPSDPQILYAGAASVYKGYQGGLFWEIPGPYTQFNNTAVATIGVSNLSSDTLMVGTGGRFSGSAVTYEVFASTNGAVDWVNVTRSLPRRYPTDISFDPRSSRTVFITFSGYDTTHVFKTTNLGQSWIDISSNLPDIPTQSIVVDPAYPEHIYVGTDLGVFRTLDGGASWHLYDNGMPATMVVDLVISKQNRVLRAATHGNGVYERRLPYVPATISAGYTERWNLLSVPLTVPDGRRNSVFPNAASLAYTFKGHYDAEETLKVGDGYFVKFSSPHTKAFIGSPVYRDTIEVRKGWNMVGSISDSVLVSSIVTIPADILEPNCYGFDGSYRLAESIQPGRGYWMKAKQAGQIILSSQGNSKKIFTFEQKDASIDRFNSLTVKDAAGNKQTLFFGKQVNEAIEADACELPPVPPAGVFDIRFASQNLIEIFSDKLEAKQQHPLFMQSAMYPITLSWNIHGNESVQYTLSDGEEINILFVKNSGEISIDRPLRSLALVVDKFGNIPNEFSLDQNYPNPFNPSTAIRYGLAEASNVSLVVYDVLGREVKTLVDKDESAGYKEVIWNGTDNANTSVSSGIYFYQCTVNPVSGGKKTGVTKKMIFMK